MAGEGKIHTTGRVNVEECFLSSSEKGGLLQSIASVKRWVVQ